MSYISFKLVHYHYILSKYTNVYLNLNPTNFSEMTHGFKLLQLNRAFFNWVSLKAETKVNLTLQGNNKNSKQTHTKGFQSKKYLSELRLKKLPEVHVNTSE